MHLILCELTDASALGMESLSPYCLKIHRALRAAGLPYERRHASNPAAHKAYNPTGQVPVLLVDGQPIADSTLILRWIVEHSSLAAPADAWLYEELADTSVSAFLVASRWADEDNWPRTQEAYFGDMPAAVRWIVPRMLRANILKTLKQDVWQRGAEACWSRFDTLLDQLDARAPAGGFWMGAELSIADIALFAQLHAQRTSLTPRQGAAVEARPRLRAWLDRVDAASAA